MPTAELPALPPPFRRIAALVAACVLMGGGAPAGGQEPQLEPAAAAWRDGYVLPPESVQELFAVDKNYATLDNVSPDGRHFLVPVSTELSTVERMGRETLRLAMLELRPEVSRTWQLDTFGDIGFRVYDLQERTYREITPPVEGFVSDATWSPEGGRFAFVLHTQEQSEVWMADAASGRMGRVSDAPVMATLAAGGGFGGPGASRLLQWTDRGSILALLVPPERGPAPRRGIATGPIVRRSREQPAPTPTYPFLLVTPTDESLFRYHTTSQIAELVPGPAPRWLGEPAMFASIALSPDGSHLLTERVVEPLSPLVGHSSFGRALEVRDLDGNVLATVRERPLQEGRGGRGGGPEADLPRDVQWLPDGSGLAWLQREPSPPRPTAADDVVADAPAPATIAEVTAEDEDGERADRILALRPPFDGEPVELARSASGLSDLLFSRDATVALVTESRDGKRVPVAFSLAAGATSSTDLAEPYDAADPLALPGEPIRRGTGNGVVHALVSSDGAVWFQGPGYREDFRPRPFIDRVPLTGDEHERIFEGSEEMYERPLLALDDDLARLTVQRESKTDFPDSWLWSRGEGFTANLTNNLDPFPEITAARRVDFEFTRRDGVKVQARISLPVGYADGDRVPAMFWTYPSEYTSARDYRRDAIRDRNHNAFTHLSYLRWSDIWLTQGYALVYPDVPIIGEPYNDFYQQHLSDTLYAAIREVDRLGFVDPDRVGHGGHSYGAFATGNLLANTPYFKAGIAGDGAYNRTLTPMGFQSERRYLWQAEETYLEMSPFFQADHIDTPLLMYHGGDDNNTGTFPIQSYRMMQALTGLGKNAVLYVYPYESHAPRALESNLDLWARWLEWFDRYVKNPGQE